MALIAVSGLLPAREPAAQPAPAAPPPAQASADRGYFGGIDLTLGPVRWGGNLTAEHRVQQAGREAKLRDLFLIGNWNAASYVYQPWFAQLTGNFGFIHAKSNSGLEEDTGSTSLTGGASVSLLPSSRFPFYGAYSVNDTRALGDTIGADYRIAQSTLRQSYRTADGATQYMVSFDRNELSNEQIGKDVLDVYGARMSSRRGPHSLDLDGQWSANTGGTIGSRTEFARAGGRHIYAPERNLSVETLASYSRQEIEQRQAGAPPTSIANTFVQLGTFANWRPREDQPLYDEKHPMLLTGALRLTGSGVGTAAAEAEVVTLSGSLGISYDISPLTRLNANAGLTHASAASGPDRQTSQLSAAVTHVAQPVRLGDYTYSWNLSGGASSLKADEQDLRSVNALAYHQVSKAVPLEGRSQVVLTVGQGLAASSVSGIGGTSPATGGGDTAVLSHNAQATWTLPADGPGAQSYVGLGATDSRSFGDVETVFQLVNLQATRQAPIDAQSHWAANITSQGVRQSGGPAVAAAGAPPDEGFQFSTFGSVSYEHRRPFGVPRLRFSASYLANQAPSQTRAQGDLNAPRERVSDSLELRLDHQIGKLESRFLVRSANVDGRRNELVLLRVTRNF
ncbi:MAG: hypothetical protein OEW90_12545 [Betaproteobacteria bacterium]|nr:hypothetical protein [Betaproteobacteria bacterium]MDH4324959.1 hypothetical protein [Betaproteobacteria bacterium]